LTRIGINMHSEQVDRHAKKKNTERQQESQC